MTKTNNQSQDGAITSGNQNALKETSTNPECRQKQMGSSELSCYETIREDMAHKGDSLPIDTASRTSADTSNKSIIMIVDGKERKGMSVLGKQINKLALKHFGEEILE